MNRVDYFLGKVGSCDIDARATRIECSPNAIFVMRREVKKVMVSLSDYISSSDQG